MGKKRKEKDRDRSREQEEEKDTPPAKKTRLDDEGSPPSPLLPPAESTLKESPQDEQVAARERMQLLVSAFSNEQQDQYEIFRRATFPKSSVRKIMQSICSTNVPQNAVIAMSGIAKVYVGEIVEAACQARDKLGESGPLQPKHIREAVRQMRKNNKIPNSRYKRVFPFR